MDETGTPPPPFVPPSPPPSLPPSLPLSLPPRTPCHSHCLPQHNVSFDRQTRRSLWMSTVIPARGRVRILRIIRGGCLLAAPGAKL